IVSSSERYRPSATLIGSTSPMRSAIDVSGVASFSAKRRSRCTHSIGVSSARSATSSRACCETGWYGSSLISLPAISGIMLLGFVLAHMIGNLKLFLGESHLNAYAEWLRDFGEPAFPRSFLLWCLRVGLIVAFVVHI